jgi:hypothetical protein
MKLPLAVVEALRVSKPDDNSFSYWYSRVNKAFSQQNLQESWQSFIGHIDDHVITYLDMTARILEVSAAQSVIAQEGLGEIRRTLTEVLDSLVDSKADKDVLRYVQRVIHALIESIDQYSITGAIPIADATDAAMGHALLNVAYREFLKETDAGKTFVGVLHRMATEIAKASGATQIELAPFNQLIGF